jgi:hypothetical protein
MLKSPIIKATPDSLEWLSSDDSVRFMFNDKPSSLKLDKEWITIGIGHSWVGNVYAYAADESQSNIDKYFIDNPFVKIFDEDYEAFMKYMKWVAKLGPWFTKQRFKKD